MTPHRQRIVVHIAIRNLSPLTQASYIGQVSLLVRHFGKSPERRSPGPGGGRTARTLGEAAAYPRGTFPVGNALDRQHGSYRDPRVNSRGVVGVAQRVALAPHGRPPARLHGADGRLTTALRGRIKLRNPAKRPSGLRPKIKAAPGRYRPRHHWREQLPLYPASAQRHYPCDLPRQHVSGQ